jgi:hypothetical protein
VFRVSSGFVSRGMCVRKGEQERHATGDKRAGGIGVQRRSSTDLNPWETVCTAHPTGLAYSLSCAAGFIVAFAGGVGVE